VPKFQVPQFIETETKLIGPLTLRQFLFVAGGVAMTAMAYVILPTFFFFIAALLILAFFGTLAFIKIDGQPALNYFAYLLSYILSPKRYIYQIKQEKDQIIPPTNG
jgi:hypothetical protein